MPDYEIKRWDENNIQLENSYSRATYASASWSRLSNQVRMSALYTEGGIYLDTDVEVLKSFDPLLSHECFLGFQQAEEDPDWANSAVIGAQAGHPFLRRCLDLTQELFAKTGRFPRSPFIVTRVLREMGLKEYGLQVVKGVTVYPSEYFYPYPWFGKFSPACIQEATYCVHFWEGSWRNQRQRAIQFPRLIMKRMMRAFSKS
jgi:mannosyltransferase OCH1-like enzyme